MERTTTTLRCRALCDPVSVLDGNYRLTSPHTRACFRQCAGFDDYPPSVAGRVAYWLGRCLSAHFERPAVGRAERDAACAPPYSGLQVATALLAVMCGLLVVVFLGVLLLQ